MNPKLRLASILALAALAAAAAAQDDARTITISPKAGEQARYRATQSQKQTMSAMAHEATNEMVTDLQVKVDEVGSDGTVKATVTWQRVRGKLQSMMGEFEFDTERPDAGADDPMFGSIAEACLAALGRPTVLTFAADGSLVDRKPLEELTAKMADKLEGPTKMMLHGLMGVHALENQASVFGSFAKEPIAVGGTWTDKKEIDGRGGLAMVTEIKQQLTSATDDEYRTTATGTVTTAPAKKDDAADADDDEQMAMMRSMMREAKIKNGKVDGDSRVARKDGLLVASRMTAKMDIEMPNPMGAEEPLVVQVEQTTKVERITGEPAQAAPAKDAPPAPKK